MTNARTVSFEEVAQATAKIGYEAQDIRCLSTHPGDWYLKVVKAYNAEKGEYAVWLYNATFQSLNEGTYTQDVNYALDRFLNKG